MTFYTLISENLTGLGGPMGSERTTTNWRKHFRSEENAKKYAEEDYRKKAGRPGVRKLKWIETGNAQRTDDLGFVMYHVQPAQFEDKE